MPAKLKNKVARDQLPKPKTRKRVTDYLPDCPKCGKKAEEFAGSSIALQNARHRRHMETCTGKDRYADQQEINPRTGKPYKISKNIRDLMSAGCVAQRGVNEYLPPCGCGREAQSFKAPTIAYQNAKLLRHMETCDGIPPDQRQINPRTGKPYKWSDASRQRRSEKMEVIWKNPDLREKQSKSRREAWKRPDVRIKRVAGLSAAHRKKIKDIDREGIQIVITRNRKDGRLKIGLAANAIDRYRSSDWEVLYYANTHATGIIEAVCHVRTGCRTYTGQEEADYDPRHMDLGDALDIATPDVGGYWQDPRYEKDEGYTEATDRWTEAETVAVAEQTIYEIDGVRPKWKFPKK